MKSSTAINGAELKVPAEPAAQEPAMSSLAFALYLCFIISWFVHLAARSPVLGAIRFDLLLVAAITSLAVMNRPKSEGRLPTLLALLGIYIVLTTPLVEWPGSVVRSGLEKLVKAVVFFFFTTWLVTSERRLKLTVALFVACQVFRVVEPVYLHETTGYWGGFGATMANEEVLYRLSGSPYDVVNPNGLAFVILTAFCFAHFLWTRTWSGKLAYGTVLPVLLYALVLTGSRSGMIGLVAAFGAVFLKSRHKFLLATAALVACAIAVPRLDANMADRYLSLISSNTKNAVTVDYRMTGLEMDLRVAMRRPLFGHGLGTSREANANFGGRDQPSHNLYTEIVQELGIGGLVIFLMIIGTIVGNLRTAIARVRNDRGTGAYLLAVANALSAWMFLNIAFSFASYGLTSYEWYFAAGLSQALLRLAPANESTPEATTAASVGGMGRVASATINPDWRDGRPREEPSLGLANATYLPKGRS